MGWIDTPESSTIRRFCYDPDRRILSIEFKNGKIYDYFDVPEGVFTSMVAASSKGKFLASQIKGKYRYQSR